MAEARPICGSPNRPIEPGKTWCGQKITLETMLEATVNVSIYPEKVTCEECLQARPPRYWRADSC